MNGFLPTTTSDCGESLRQIQPSGLLENLQAEKRNLESKLEKINAALTALQKYPEMVEVFQAISKIRF